MAETVESPAARELIARASAVAAIFAEDAAEAERLRKPTDRAIRAAEDAGLFRLMVPACYGGLELDLDTFVEVGLVLGEADASLAWVTTFCIEHCWIFCQFPEAFQRKLFADRSWVLAPGSIVPNGEIVPEPGGYRLSGRWQWGTGVMHASWVIVGGVIPGDPPDVRWLALPISDARVEDTWFTDGMAGTGSNDIVVDGVFVEEDRTVSMLAMSAGTAHGARLHPGPLYRTPMLPILATAATLPIVGQARAALRQFRRRLESRVLLGGTRQSELASTQIRLARVEIQVRQAELLLRDVVADVMRLRDAASLLDRARWTAALASVVHQSRDAIRSIADASGASAHHASDPLQRMVRDANTMSAHAVFDLDGRLELYGKLSLGHDPGLALV